MTARFTALASALFLFVCGSTTSSQVGAPLAGAKLDQVCVVVGDIEQTGRALTRVFGVEVAAANTFLHQAPTRQGNIKYAIFRLPYVDFNFELIQPLDGSTAIHDFFKAHGQSVQHINFKVPDRMAERVALLQKHAPVTGGRPGVTGYNLLDFIERLGTTFEITQGPGQMPPAAPAHPPGPVSLGTQKVTHIGIVLRDVEKAAREYSELLGVPTPRVTVPDRVVAGDPKSQAKIVTIPTAGLALELIEPVGSSSMWTEFVAQRGFTVHHVTFDVGDRLDATRDDLVAKGGRAIAVTPGAPYRYVDFMSQFSLVIELRGIPSR